MVTLGFVKDSILQDRRKNPAEAKHERRRPQSSVGAAEIPQSNHHTISGAKLLQSLHKLEVVMSCSVTKTMLTRDFAYFESSQFRAI